MVLISTHIIDTIKEVWDKILIMNKGTIVSSILREEIVNENEIEEGTLLLQELRSN